MKNNQPVTQREYPLADDTLIMSITDPQSRIVYVNPDFVAASGFEQAELTGQPHSMVRHPDMPAQAFADMWRTIASGESWVGVVKNRRKNGDHYWVRANATPIGQDGTITGYTSVRVKPSRAEVETAEALYRKVSEGHAGKLAFHKGLVVRRGVLGWLSWGQLMPVRWRIRLGMGGALLMAALGVSLAGRLSLDGGLAMLLGGLTGCFWLERQIALPLSKILEEARRAACGQPCRAEGLNRVDEIGMLMRNVHQANLNLQSLIKDVTLRSDTVGSSGTAISLASADLSIRTESQARELEQTGASMEELSSAVRHNADHTKQATELAQTVSEVATRGGDAVAQVVETMQGINESSRRIADIIGLIDGIAFQTNILALNAAVEAARAGEQGRSFSVVASEVRVLAARSAEAAKEIKALITDSVGRVGRGVEQAERAGATMTEVVGGIQRVTQIIRDISIATDEQSGGVAQVGTAIMQMERVTQQNASMVHDMTVAVDTLRAQMTGLDLATQVFNQMADIKVSTQGARLRPS